MIVPSLSASPFSLLLSLPHLSPLPHLSLSLPPTSPLSPSPLSPSPLSLPPLSPSLPPQIGFWDPRSDDDQLIVTSLHFQEDLLAVGLQGGVVLLFTLNTQSATVNIKVYIIHYAVLIVYNMCSTIVWSTAHFASLVSRRQNTSSICVV